VGVKGKERAQSDCSASLLSGFELRMHSHIGVQQQGIIRGFTEAERFLAAGCPKCASPSETHKVKTHIQVFRKASTLPYMGECISGW